MSHNSDWLRRSKFNLQALVIGIQQQIHQAQVVRLLSPTTHSRHGPLHGIYQPTQKVKAMLHSVSVHMTDLTIHLLKLESTN